MTRQHPNGLDDLHSESRQTREIVIVGGAMFADTIVSRGKNGLRCLS